MAERRAINRKAHELALVQERRIKAELIAQAIASQDCAMADRFWLMAAGIVDDTGAS